MGLAAREDGAAAAREAGRDCDCGWANAGCGGGWGDAARGIVLTVGEDTRLEVYELRPTGVPYAWAGAVVVWARGLLLVVDAA